MQPDEKAMKEQGPDHKLARTRAQEATAGG